MDNTFTWRDVPGYFDFSDFYDARVAEAQDGAKFVEVGVYYGRSANYMASAIKASGKNISFDAIDSYSHPLFNAASEKMARHFMGLIGNDDLINLRVMDQLDAAATYADNSLDFVFIDSDHSFEATCNAIHAFLPKVKVGGIIAGDDYDIIGFAHVVKAVQRTLPNWKSDKRVFYATKV